ncbi:MAG: hypothetical protein P8J50_07450 [Acidimicrobiales bacterium]|nr:hypothetical protein [Acidimicrobiales bacterium]
MQDTYSLIPSLPASPQAAVRDAQPSIEATTGTAPAIIFSHGFAGHRRQSTHLATHLVSHGYVVAAPNHVGTTTPEVFGWAMGIGAPDDTAEYTLATGRQRVDDSTTTLDGLLAGEFGVTGASASVGMSGHSFGGWTTLATTAADQRIRATLPLAPAGGDKGLRCQQVGNACARCLRLRRQQDRLQSAREWQRHVRSVRVRFGLRQGDDHNRPGEHIARRESGPARQDRSDERFRRPRLAGLRQRQLPDGFHHLVARRS